MKTRHAVALAVVAGFGLGALSLEALHAQQKPPVYFVAEIEIKDLNAYTKEYAPLAQASVKKFGGQLLAAGQNVVTMEGAPPKARVVVQRWESMERIKAWRASSEYQKAREVGNKHATFRSFAVEGLPQK